MADGALVTILFTDLVGTSELDESVGDDAATQLRRRHFRVIREAVSGSGGEEVKSLGDGLMVAFSSAVDAVAAAVAIQQRVARDNRGANDHPIGVRIGLNTGEPIRDEEDYFGTSVNIARRLCDAAASGQILTTALLRDLVGSRGEFRFTDVGELRLRGLSEPVPACEVDWRHAAPGPAPLPRELEAPTRSPFVGRDADMRQLSDCWDNTAGGRPQLVAVAGEPGVGKSRLVREFARTQASAGATVLFGRCDPEAILPYQPFAEAIRGFVETCPPARLRAVLGEGSGELARLIPELADRLPTLERVPILDEPETERYRLFQAIAGVLTSISATSPLLLVLDDLHWADHQTLMVLKHVCTRMQSAPMMILATYRDVEVDRRHPLAQVIADIRRETDVARVNLGGLTGPEVKEFLDAVGGEDIARRPDGLAESLREDTGGNPFFLEEIVRHIHDTGGLPPTGEAGVMADLGVPEGIRDMVARRLGTLTPECQRVLAAASVLGPEFDFRLLQRVADLSMGELLDTLAGADEAQVVVEAPGLPGAYAFAHSLVRQALYEDLGAARKMRLHQRAGQALEELHAGRLEDHFSELAHHFLEAAPAGEVEKAVDFALAAGRQASSQLAYEEAISHYSGGLQAMGEVAANQERRCRLLLGLGDARSRAGEPGSVRETFAEAAALARILGSADLLAEAAIGFGGFSSFGDVGIVDTELVALIEEALGAIGDAPSGARCRLLARLSIALYWEEETARRGDFALEAVALARRLDDPAVLAHALKSAIIAIWSPDTVDDRLTLSHELVRLAQASGDRELEVTGRNYRAAALLELARIEEAYAEIDVLYRVAEAVDAPAARWQSISYRALQAILQGRFGEGEELAGQALGLGHPVRAQAALQGYSAQIYSIRWNQGRLNELVDTVVGLVEQAGGLSSWRAALAMAYKEIGRLEEASREFAVFVECDFTNCAKNATYLSTLGTLSEVCTALGDVDSAAKLYRLLEPYQDRVVMLGWGALSQASVASHMGALASLMGDLDAADRQLARAEELDRRMGAEPWAARVDIIRARVLRQRGRAGDMAAADQHLSRARDIAGRLGMGYLAGEIEAIRAQPAPDVARG